MTGPLAYAVVAVSVVLGIWALALVVLDRRVDGRLVIGVGVLEALLVVYLVVGLAQTLTTDRTVEKATLVGYLVALAVIPPLATVWSLEEKTRASAGVLAVTFLVVAPVMVARVAQVWGA